MDHIENCIQVIEAKIEQLKSLQTSLRELFPAPCAVPPTARRAKGVTDE